MGLAPNFATVFGEDSIGCEVPDPIFSQPLRVIFAHRRGIYRETHCLIFL